MSIFTLLGIDPGSACLGLCILNINSFDLSIHSAYTKTLFGHKHPQNHQVNETYGSTTSMLHGHSRLIEACLVQTQAVALFCESPFYNSRMPSAYGSLIRALEHIKKACIQYDPYMLYDTVDPSTAKKTMGVNGISKNKLDMLKALETLEFYPRIHFDQASEHEIDATAVAYWGYKTHFLTPTPRS